MAATTRREFDAREGAAPGKRPQNVHIGIGPAHPAMHGIIRSRPSSTARSSGRRREIGYLHRRSRRTRAGRLEQRDPLHRTGSTTCRRSSTTSATRPRWRSPGRWTSRRCKYIRVIMSRFLADLRPPTLRGRLGNGARRLHGLPYMIKARSSCGSWWRTSPGQADDLVGRVGGVKADRRRSATSGRASRRRREVLGEVTPLLTATVSSWAAWWASARSRARNDRYAITGRCCGVGVPTTSAAPQPYYVYDR